MEIRIKPQEIEVPENDPFNNDLLGRKEPVTILTHLIGSFKGPCVLAVDAAWGNGKTTFLKIWSQYLRNQGFPVVEFNAWETDFSEAPFVALSSELTDGLENYKDKNKLLADKIDATKKVATNVMKKLLRLTATGAIRFATGGILDITPLLEQEEGQARASYAEDRLSDYLAAKQEVKKFRCVLQDMATEMSKQKNKPFIVMIDELDRCRPSYAVELLEVAKHLFSVDHMVFVLAVNRSELAHSIRALYGSGFDAEGYLRRFFDVDFRLPDPEREGFINTMLSATKIDDYLMQPTYQYAPQLAKIVRNLLQCFFRAPDLSLRRIAQTIHRLGLVFAIMRSDQRSFDRTALTISTVVALILRTIDEGHYHRFVRGDISDLEVVNSVFKRPEAKTLQEGDEGCLFEATIIAAAHDLSVDHSKWNPGVDTPLFQHYKNLLKAEESSDEDQNHAHKVIRTGNIFWRKNGENWERIVGDIGFRHSVERIELLFPESLISSQE